jgi:hypothetical protein
MGAEGLSGYSTYNTTYRTSIASIAHGMGRLIEDGRSSHCTELARVS